MPASVTATQFGVQSLPAGMRATRATKALLALIDASPEQLWSAAEVQARLDKMGVQVNRVTTYRLLDRLASAGRLVKSVDAERLTRYGAGHGALLAAVARAGLAARAIRVAAARAVRCL